MLGNPAHMQCHVWQLIKEVKQSLVGEEKYTVLITWIHVAKQALKLPQMTPFDLQGWYFSDHKHLFSAFIFVHLTEAALYCLCVNFFLPNPTEFSLFFSLISVTSVLTLWHFPLISRREKSYNLPPESLFLPSLSFPASCVKYKPAEHAFQGVTLP